MAGGEMSTANYRANNHKLDSTVPGFGRSFCKTDRDAFRAAHRNGEAHGDPNSPPEKPP